MTFSRREVGLQKLAFYRLSTVVFALLFAFMVQRELTRSDHEPAPDRMAPSERRSPEIGRELSSPDRKPEDDPEPEPEPGEDPREAVLEPEAAPEEALALAMRLLFRSGGSLHPNAWPRVLEQLEPRKAEVIPLLEDWLRRGDELWKERIYLENVPRAYANLAGADAIPLLRQLIETRARVRGYAVPALCRIDDARAVEFIREHQESAPDNTWFVNPGDLWLGPEGFKDLVREWMAAPPRGQVGIAEDLKWHVFRYGTNEDREALWHQLDRRLRLRVCAGRLARHWGPPWPDRFLALVTKGLTDPDPWVRYLAADHIILQQKSIDAELLARAERTLEADIAKGQAEGDAPELKRLKSSLGRLRTWRADLEAARRKAELLKPR